MAALTDQRSTPEADHPARAVHAVLAADSTQFFKGGMVALNASGLLVKASTSTTLRSAGRCRENFTTGVSNTRKIEFESGLFKYANSAAGDLIAQDDIGESCYFVDDQTVAIVATARSIAGTVYQVDADGVWVLFTYPAPQVAPAGA